MNELTFLKLGGSLLTDKTLVEAVRADLLHRVAAELRQARAMYPQLKLLLGHGSGSFGHVPAARHGTRQGVQTAAGWSGFAEVSAAAARLNRLVVEALLAESVPAISIQPSASAVCRAGEIQSIGTDAIKAALAAGLLPVVYGDVAFDTELGGTIISTEEIMIALSAELDPGWILLAGETPGVYDAQGNVIPQITSANFSQVEQAIGGSRGTDVTGGMASKVRSMLATIKTNPRLSIRIFSALHPGELLTVLGHHAGELAEAGAPGTVISAGR